MRGGGGLTCCPPSVEVGLEDFRAHVVIRVAVVDVETVIIVN